VSGATKRFGATVALDDVSLRVERGEIHALMGGNGSGKSTLIKCLAGVQSAARGVVHRDGETVELASMTPATAARLGIVFVHQDAAVFPELTVAENLVVGGEYPRRRLGIDWRAVRAEAERVLDEHDIRVDPDSLLADAGPAMRMQLAVARCLASAARSGRSAPVLVLDEPTASLPAGEVAALTRSLGSAVERGAAILLVTHRFDEVFAMADRVTVIRDGRLVGSEAVAALTHARLASMMIGDQDRPTDLPWEVESARGTTVLRADGIDAAGLRDVDVTVDAGEIVGVLGLLGSGRTRLLETLYGLHAHRGVVTVDGARVTPGDIPSSIAAGMAFVGEDRLRAGAFLDLGIDDNLSLARLGRYGRAVRWSQRRAGAEGAEVCRDYDIRCAGPRAHLSTLSGGNQQKVMLARWLVQQPRVLLLDEPTQGVDIGAKSQIYGLVRAAAAEGAAVLVASSDLEELATLCHRVVVMRDGALANGPSSPFGVPDLVTHVLKADTDAH